jgi:hypothetical protein
MAAGNMLAFLALLATADATVTFDVNKGGDVAGKEATAP